MNQTINVFIKTVVIINGKPSPAPSPGEDFWTEGDESEDYLRAPRVGPLETSEGEGQAFLQDHNRKRRELLILP